MDELKARLERQMDQLNEKLGSIEDRRSTSHNGVSTITINAGGVGVWLCATLSGMILVAVLIGAFWMSREFNRYDVALSERKEEGDRAQTYLSSIYGRMPQWMREEVEREASSKLKEKEK